MQHLKANNLASLSGRIGLVTGGGTGIGLMIAKTLAANGAKVYIVGRRLDVLKKTAEEIDPEGLIPMRMDITDKNSIKEAVEQVEREFGKLDILVNSAGVVGPHSQFISDETAPEHAALGQSLFEKETTDAWIDVLRTNTIAPFFVITGFLSLLQKGAESRGQCETSSVINISSAVSTLKLSMDIFAYGASKAGLDHLTRSMATEFAVNMIPVRVNGIAPGLFPSQLGGSIELANQLAAKAMPGEFNPAPAHRAGREEEMAMTALYLASSSGGYTNGVTIRVDGGHNLVNP